MKRWIWILAVFCVILGGFSTLDTGHSSTKTDKSYQKHLSIKTFAGGLSDRWAILIGIADYPGSINDLSFPDDDVHDFYDLLIEKCLFPPDHVKVLLNASATKKNISDAIVGWLANNETENDVVLIYYSGHGTRINSSNETDGYDECLAQYDYETASPITDDEFDELLDLLDSDNVIIIIDSCFSGGMTKAIDSHLKSIRNTPKVSIRDGFKKDISKDGRIILMSSDENEYSYDGVFTPFLMEGFKSILADSNDDGCISPEEAFDYAYPLVVSSTENISTGAQHPQIYDGILREIDLSILKNVYNPNASKAFDSIQQAIDNATEGDTIIVNANEYRENIIIDKEIKLIGIGNPIIDCSGNVGIMVEADNVSIENFTICNGSIGIYIDFSDNILVSNCNITNSGEAIKLWDSTNCTITNCTAINNSWRGIYLDYSNNCTITNCLVSNNNWDGIYLDSSTNCTITDCIVNNNDDGIYLDYSNNCTITNCTVSNNNWKGIYLYYSTNCTVFSCNISDNHGEGIYMTDSSCNKICNSTIANNVGYVGLVLSDSLNNSICNCSFIRNGISIQGYDTSSIFYIHLCNNT
ncbi:MAG TPA: hypothetical protein ENG74_00310, partial [Thermoplasmatales archaeon]|nr:hypothetical protein [Thermoplasmatales archaeon]